LDLNFICCGHRWLFLN